jgi:hypothetical protein
MVRVVRLALRVAVIITSGLGATEFSFSRSEGWFDTCQHLPVLGVFLGTAVIVILK